MYPLDHGLEVAVHEGVIVAFHARWNCGAAAHIFSGMRPISGIICGLLTAAIAFPALALEVYQWTDENGVVHFSQWAPDEAVENVETVRVEGGGEKDYGIGVSEEDDPEGYEAHRKDMEALWAGIEARREAERQARESAPGTEVIYVNAQPDYGYPYLFPGRGLRPPFRPDRPGHSPADPDDRDRPGRGPPASVPFKRP